MEKNWNRTAAGALIAGSVLATVGYLAANLLIPGTQEQRLTTPFWWQANAVAIAGDLLVIAGLPVVLAVQNSRFRVLTLVGVFGTYLALALLNVGEGLMEAFVKPYLVRHGGIPASVAGYDVYENTALVCMLVGLVCFGIAVILAKRFPWWVGVLLIASPFASLAGLPGAFAEVADYLLFAALTTIGVLVLRNDPRQPEPAPRRAAVAGAVR